MYLISIYFDKQTNQTLQRYITQIAEKTGNTFMIEHKVPPHMTISAIKARKVEELVPAFESLKGKISGGEVTFASVGQLLPYVFYTTPVLNAYLQGLSEQIFQTFSLIEETSISKFYRPFSWLPHVTLGKTLTKEQMQKAFSIMQDSFAPFSARCTEIGLAKVNPHEDVIRYHLK